MKIGIDISQIVYEGTGVSRFTKGLIEAILKYDNINEWVFFFSSLRENLDVGIEKKIENKGHKLIKWKLPPTLLSFLWNDLHHFPPSLPDLDWFITSDWTEPPLPDMKKATVIHDLAYVRYPETVHETIRKTQEKRLNWVKKESQMIFADSESTKNDLVELLSFPNKHILVNYPGVEILKPSKNHIEDVLKKHELTNTEFILTVGKLEPRKNFERLIQAYQKLHNPEIQLVIVGPEGWNNLKNLKSQMSNVKILGLVSDEELYSLYSSCLIFVYPSLWEGFGYPLIEAMQLGAPSACSKTSSLAEIGDKAVLFFNPEDTDDIAKKMGELVNSNTLRNSLESKGKERSKAFTWEKYYNTMIEGLQES
jgi:glycosyltransferase involved in cell wall biosynthesis